MSSLRVVTTGLLAVALLVAATATAVAQQTPELRLVTYRLTDVSAETSERFSEAEGAALLDLFSGATPRLDVRISVPPGEEVAVREARTTGSVRAEPAPGHEVLVTLSLDGFYEGSTLRIDRCVPFVVARARFRVQGKTQLSMKAVEYRDATCG